MISVERRQIQLAKQDYKNHLDDGVAVLYNLGVKDCIDKIYDLEGDDPDYNKQVNKIVKALSECFIRDGSKIVLTD